jgi:HEAT repeat protein
MADEDLSTNIDSQKLTELEQNLRAAGLYQRWAAMNELVTFPAQVSLPIFQRLLAEKDVGLRRLAVVGLGKNHNAETFQTLQTILDEGNDPIIVAEAANAIFEFGDVAIPLLQDLFVRSPHWLVRQTIISAMVETDRYEVILSVATIALTDETKAIRELGILALKRVLQSDLQASALAILASLAQDADWQIRWCTAISLHGCPVPQARELIAQLQQDADFRVVAAALEGLTG